MTKPDTPAIGNGEASEAIAAKLTKTQRATLVRAEADGHLGHLFVRWWHGSGRTIRSLRRLGLGTTVWSGLILTPLGQAVRAHLERPHP